MMVFLLLNFLVYCIEFCTCGDFRSRRWLCERNVCALTTQAIYSTTHLCHVHVYISQDYCNMFMYYQFWWVFKFKITSFLPMCKSKTIQDARAND